MKKVEKRAELCQERRIILSNNIFTLKISYKIELRTEI
jgi:hypothetical protein